MATRFNNESTGSDSTPTCQPQVIGPVNAEAIAESASHFVSIASAGETTKKTRMLRRILLMATLGFLLYPAVGCTMLSGLSGQMSNNTAIDDFLVSYRNDAWAAKAWHCRKKNFCNKRYLSDIERGFRDGYKSVADGGNGCVPAVCPQSYWGWQYQAADGQARMNAWFEGFPLGVQAAEQDGIGNWSQVRTSMAYPPAGPQPMGAAPTAAAPMEVGLMGPATGTLTDQVEAVPKPMAEPAAKVMPKAPVEVKPMPKPAPPAAVVAPPAAANAQPKVEAPKLELPKADAPKLDAPEADAAKVVPPAEKPAPAVPQPNADPFGFD